jgi:5-methyltetrahydrofolate--homocysteine methyltransferase
MTIKLHFTDQDWERIERDWTAWWEGDLKRPMVIIENQVSPPDGTLSDSLDWAMLPAKFPMDVPASEVLDQYEMALESKRYHGDAWPKWWPNFGPGIAAGFLGADVGVKLDTVWFSSTKETDIEDLHLAYDADNVWWRRVKDLTVAAVERWGDQVTVAHTDLGGNLDILASLHTTEKLLFDTIDAPNEVVRLAGEITALWLRYYDELYNIIQASGRGTTPWAPIWSPGRTYMLQCDFAYMISPHMFERFVMPDLASCCEALDHGFYHLDGKGQIPHLDMLLSLERLRGIQWIPGDGQPPPEEWLPLLKRIRDGGKLCQLYVTPEGARTVVQEIGGRGFAFHIAEWMGQEDAQAFIRLLASDDAGERVK